MTKNMTKTMSGQDFSSPQIIFVLKANFSANYSRSFHYKFRHRIHLQ